MTAPHKLHKFRDKYNDGYYKPKFTNPDSVERQRAKEEIKQGLEDTDDLNDLQIRAEIQWEEEMRLSYECYLKEKADPDNYTCRCFDKKDNNED
jgi:hypothetical protein